MGGYKRREYLTVKGLVDRLYDALGGPNKAREQMIPSSSEPGKPMSLSRASEYTNPDASAHISAENLLNLVKAARAVDAGAALGAAELFALHAGGFVTPIDPGHESLAELWGMTSKEFGASCAALFEAHGRHKSGALGPAERDGLFRSVHRMLRFLAAIAAKEKGAGHE